MPTTATGSVSPAARGAFEAERCVVLFPAGRLARMEDGALTDPEWAPTAASLARKYRAPIVPIHVSGPYSRLFHFFNRFSAELRDVTLFHELLNKKGCLYLTRPSLMTYNKERAEMEACAKALFDMVTSGKVKIRVDQRYAMADAAQAHRDLEARKTTGQSLLIP